MARSSHYQICKLLVLVSALALGMGPLGFDDLRNPKNNPEDPLWWSPLKKIKTMPNHQKEETIPTSPLKEIYYLYTIPIRTIEGLEEMELHIAKEAREELELSVEEIARELEEKLPLIIEEAIESKQIRPEQVYKVKIRGREVPKEEIEVRGEEVKEEEEGREKPRIKEVEILIKIIWGEGKLIIELPPLTPEELEDLIRKLEVLVEKIARGKIPKTKL